MLFSKIVKTIQLFPKKGVKKFLFENKMVCLTSYKISIALKKPKKQIGSISEAGDNKDQFALIVKEFFPKTGMFSFQSVYKIYGLLREKCPYINNASTCNIKLRNSIGKLKFYNYNSKYSQVHLVLVPVGFKQAILFSVT